MPEERGERGGTRAVREVAARHVGAVEPRPLRLLVVDDHEVVRQGLVSLLERREQFQVVAEAGTVAEAIEAARRHQPDLVVMDVRLPDGSGIEACREIRSELPGDPGGHAHELPRRGGGAVGHRRRRVAATSSSRSGRATWSPPSRRSAAASRCSTRPSPRRCSSACGGSPTGTYTDELAQLTAQEQKILLLVAEGKTNKEIAAEVFLSDKTVKNYVSSILSKLNLQRRAQAAAFVAKHRLPGSGT